jgi:hypothetical protein
MDAAQRMAKTERAGGNYGAGTKELQARNYVSRKEQERKRRELFDDALVKFNAGEIEVRCYRAGLQHSRRLLSTDGAWHMMQQLGDRHRSMACTGNSRRARIASCVLTQTHSSQSACAQTSLCGALLRTEAQAALATAAGQALQAVC